MEFWGAEVKVGESVKVDPQEFEACIHLSQAALGESKKDKANEPVVIYLKVGDQKLVLGTLNREKIPQTTLELVLDKEFELSHSSKTSSVHFCGYKAYYPDNEYSDEDDYSDSDEEEIPLAQPIENGKPEIKVENQKVSEAKKAPAKTGVPAKPEPPAKSGTSGKQVKVVDPKEEKDDDSDDESDDELDSSDEELDDADSEDEDESDEEEDEETPVKKVDQGKKRANESASKTPVPSKKSKNATPEKTDGKKAGHTATPHPKKAGKTPNSDAKSPKSGGHLSCSSCSKTFNSETGLTQHTKAKHGAQ
ncbi:unnamed protein product [Lathyrus oleraceus]